MGRNPDRLRLATQGHELAAIRRELDDHVRAFVDHPHVVLRIDTNRVRRQEPINLCADLVHILSVPVELEQPRTTMDEVACGADRHELASGARIDEQVPLRIRCNAGDLPEIQVLRQRQQIRRGVVTQRRDGVCRRGGTARQRHNHRGHGAPKCPSAKRLRTTQLTSPHGRAFPKRIFCARQEVISDT